MAAICHNIIEILRVSLPFEKSLSPYLQITGKKCGTKTGVFDFWQIVNFNLPFAVNAMMDASSVKK